MCRIGILLLLQRLKEYFRKRARFKKHRDSIWHQVFFFLQGKAHKEIHAILTESWGEPAQSFSTVKILVAQFKRCDLSTCVAPRPGLNKTVTISDFIDQIHELILEYRQIWAKSKAEQVGISREGFDSIIHEHLHMGKLSAKCAPKCVNFTGSSRLSYVWNSSGAI